MMMQLIDLRLGNFKGIKSLIVNTKGGNVNIYGDNATGKTTVYDAFLWLLLDKDSANKKDFNIKTLDLQGNPLHGLSHEVEATFSIDGKRITLAKCFEEQWTKKRGSAEKQFTGHTTAYHIDGVPVKKTEYTARIDQIAREDIFRLLTNPMYFNTHLHWQERRRILLDVCGDLTDDEVISSDKAFAKLPDILQGRKLEDHKKIVASKRKAINDELQKIPVRIDEVQQSLPDTSGINPDELNQKISALKARIREKEQQISRIEDGGEVAEKTKALRELEGRLIQIKNQRYSQYSDQVSAKQTELDVVKDKVRDLHGEAQSAERMRSFNESEIQSLHSQMDKLRTEWSQVNEQQFIFEQDDTCPTCGQPLPADKLDAAREKALAQFNRSKAERLESISERGKQLKAKAGELTMTNADLGKKLADICEKLNAQEAQAKALQDEIGSMRMKMAEYDKDPAYIQAMNRKHDLEAAIADLQSGRRGEVSTVKAEINVLENEIRFAESRLADLERSTQGLKRIEELGQQERQLAAEFEKLEGELYLCEQFVRAKVAMLEERINSRFKMARFKLFDEQINGGLVEVCETMYRGVPYGSMNNAARINVGLDIIRTLSEHYGFAAPVFIDNAEAVTELVDPGTQVIRLVVSVADKKLRVEYPEQDGKYLEREDDYMKLKHMEASFAEAEVANEIAQNANGDYIDIEATPGSEPEPEPEHQPEHEQPAASQAQQPEVHRDTFKATGTEGPGF
jgi:predicted  nucleic acid-binding Zn-ribbon protein